MTSEQAKNIPETAAENPMDYGTHCLDREYMEKYARGLSASKMQENHWRRPRFFQLLEMLKLTRGLNGALLEAGCFRGLASNLICQTLREEDPEFKGKRYFMVDSFEGLSPPGEEDGAFSMQRYSEGAFRGTSLKRCRQTMAEFPQARIIKGWIPEVFEQLPDQRYRFVHVDVDIFHPTLHCLGYFYPRLVKGGMIVIDDYGPWPLGNWPGCSKAVQQFCREHDVPFAKLDTGNAVIIRR